MKTKMQSKLLELYFHIPFCIRKCAYCDFLSAPAGNKQQEGYMDALLTETIERACEYRDYTVVSVFIGGGTPSMLDSVQMVRLLSAVKRYYSLSVDAEITIEVNPKTVDVGKLTDYKKAGINRLSIGLQSASDEELKTIGRIHTRQDFLDTYRDAVAAGFTNINVDIMSALPGQTEETYLATLKTVTGLQPAPTHISAYSLILEEGTALYEAVQKGRITLPDEEMDRRLYELTEKELRKSGYERYEISNYAKVGYECRHNCGYWTRTEYVGFGIGAASLISNVRFTNSSKIEDYLKHPLQCRENYETLSVQDRMEEFMFLGLRMTCGISVNSFREIFQREIEEVYGEVIDKNIRDGLLQYSEGKDRLSLTPRGLDLSNYVYAQFLFS